MPLHWDEVTPGLKMSDFTILNSVEHVRSAGDHFSGVLGKGINLKKSLKNIETTFGNLHLHKSLLI
jgi:bifunctional non-homologous end joining protein LigD